MSEELAILTINGGSSSIKLALYEEGKPLKRILHGTVNRIGLSGTKLTFHGADGKPQQSRRVELAWHRAGQVAQRKGCGGDFQEFQSRYGSRHSDG